MSKTYKILAEKYNQIHEDDIYPGSIHTDLHFNQPKPPHYGLERLSKEFKLFVFFKRMLKRDEDAKLVRGSPNDINSILDEWKEGIPRDDPKEIYDWMVETIDMVFEDKPSWGPRFAAVVLANEITSLDAKARVKQWFNSRYPSITLH